MRTGTYYFGRLNFLALIKDKTKFILKGLREAKIVNIGDFSWGLFGIEQMNTAIGSVITGELVKYEPEGEEIVAEPETHKLKPATIENKVRARSRFIIELESNLIAYHPTYGITKNQFCSNFTKLFEDAYDILVNVEIQSIDEPLKFIKELERFHKIDMIKIYLHPSNPSNRDMWDDIDKKLKKRGVSYYTEELKAKKDPSDKGLINIQDDEEIKSKIIMSEDGYGETKVSGYLDKEYKTISTRNNPIKAEAPIGTEVEPYSIIDSLRDTFEKIKSRFKHDS